MEIVTKTAREKTPSDNDRPLRTYGTPPRKWMMSIGSKPSNFFASDVVLEVVAPMAHLAFPVVCDNVAACATEKVAQYHGNDSR